MHYCLTDEEKKPRLYKQQGNQFYLQQPASLHFAWSLQQAPPFSHLPSLQQAAIPSFLQQLPSLPHFISAQQPSFSAHLLLAQQSLLPSVFLQHSLPPSHLPSFMQQASFVPFSPFAFTSAVLRSYLQHSCNHS